VHEITPNELAKTLGVTGLTFRNWLRAQKAAGHPLIAGHEYRTRYRFTPDEASQLIAEYRSSKGTAPASPGAPVAPARRTARSAERASPSTRPPLPSSFSRTALESRVRRMGDVAEATPNGLLADSRAARRIRRLPARRRLPDVRAPESCRMVQG
jgi:hypothetical protein